MLKQNRFRLICGMYNEHIFKKLTNIKQAKRGFITESQILRKNGSRKIPHS